VDLTGLRDNLFAGRFGVIPAGFAINKDTLFTEELCKDLPEEFPIYLHYCRALKYEDTPDYGFLRQLFKDLVVREGLQYDLAFDWTGRPGKLEISEEQS